MKIAIDKYLWNLEFDLLRGRSWQAPAVDGPQSAVGIPPIFFIRINGRCPISSSTKKELLTDCGNQSPLILDRNLPLG